MKLTTKQIKHIIKEELQEMMGMGDQLSKLLDSENEKAVIQGIELALTLGMPIVIKNISRYILRYVQASTDPELLTLMAQPETHKRILIRIAQNQNTPIEIIHKIATNPDYDIRASNYAIQNLNLYCDQHPDDKICARSDTMEYRS